MRAVLIGLMLASAPALAQAPAAGSGAGGPVGQSVPTPTVPTGAVPPGTAARPEVRDAIGQAVIGKTEALPTPMPGNTGGADSGVRK